MRNVMGLVLLLSVWAAGAHAQPRFEIDPAWPKPLPERWIFGELGGVCVDSHDHIAIVDRRNITNEEKQTSIPGPTFVMFDRAGNVVHSWGDPDVVPADVHGCTFDAQDNLWVAGNEDAIVQGYSHEGKLLLQIGTKGQFDTADGTRRGQYLNKSPVRLNTPAQAVVDPRTGEIFVADGYGNKRVAVFDRTGTFLRQWGRQATPEERRALPPGAFYDTVHCIVMSRKGLLYVCDRQGSRIQVFDTMGKHVRDIHVPRTDTFVEPEPVDRGTAWSVAFSPDEAQQYLYVMNGRRGEGPHPRSPDRQDAVDIRPARTPARQLHPRPHDRHGLSGQPVRRRNELGPEGTAIQSGEIGGLRSSVLSPPSRQNSSIAARKIATIRNARAALTAVPTAKPIHAAMPA